VKAWLKELVGSRETYETMQLMEHSPGRSLRRDSRVLKEASLTRKERSPSSIGGVRGSGAKGVVSAGKFMYELELWLDD